MNLLGEVIAVTEEARGLQETKLWETEVELNASLAMQDALNKLTDTIRQHYEEARKSVRIAQDEYSKALKRIPTSFKGLLMDLGRAVIGLVSLFSQSVATSGGKGTAIATSLLTGQSLTFGKLFGEALEKLADRVISFLDGFSSQITNPLTEFDAFKITFETFLSSINGGTPSDLKTKTSELIKEGISITNDVFNLTKETIEKGQNITKEAANDLKYRLNTLIDKVKPFIAAESFNGATVPPASSSSVPTSSDSSQNEKFVAEMAKDRLMDAEQRYDATFMEYKEHLQEMAKLMGKMARLDMTRINYQQILELMREALSLLAKIREQWNQLVLFFAEIAVRAEIALGGTLGPFIDQATQAGAIDLSQEERLFYVDLLKAQAVNIHKVSYDLFIMSRTYVDMSNSFLMKRLAGLSQMLTTNDDNERMRLLNQLSHETTVGQDKIISLVNERKANYTQAVAKRRLELDTFIQGLGGSSQLDLNAINDGKKLLDLIPTPDP
ncbi:unnamed protein product [Rotaria sordida]|uniref:Uncharacterized protein n=1 Tax=Rotaria sordida TaxID=392033 RepID=A0A819ZN16_9BILA|nr:unnamed protein product [Rotaria sordida]CAF1305107.1 unnamed protein product [Rotaria sordida]CAF4132288.1 unnamed protein product [Rotaria sordida]CAF4177073.1 unnamed protein product [Rotaria sordida]